MADRSAPETVEIEITPEMIEAGVKALYEYDSRFDIGYDDTVADIFRAMAAAKVE